MLICVYLLWFLYPTLRNIDLQVVEPNSVGLNWQECSLSTTQYSSEDVQACFGHSLPLSDGSETVNYGKRIDMQNLQLVVGDDTYHTSVWDDLEIYTLYHNGFPLKRLFGEFTAHSPNISLQNIYGSIAWEFDDGYRATVVINGQDVRRQYGLDKAFRPYGIGGKLIFTAQKGEDYFIIFDGQRLGPTFDRILVAHCCEAMMYSVRCGRGRYLFVAIQAGASTLVEISAVE
jgi:hypothetical protein